VRRQVGKRLGRRLAELGLQTLDQYRDRLESDPVEWGILDGFCRITISCLYRDRHVFDTLAARVLPELGNAARLRGDPVRCWCAGCACGEEVYTLKLLWELDVRPKILGAPLEIIGTDANPIVLRRAEMGCFDSSSLKKIPANWRETAFARDDHCYCVGAQYREGLEFRQQDIRVDIPVGPFGLILCRNLVFTYFDIKQQRETMAQIAATLCGDGYLVIGAHETLPDEGGAFMQIPGCREILRKTPPPSATRPEAPSPAPSTIVVSRIERRRVQNKEDYAMMRIPHELRDEFSQESQLIERLIKSDHEFGRLAASYEEINHEIYRIEPEETPTTDEVLETLKKRRLMPKNQITAFLRR